MIGGPTRVASEGAAPPGSNLNHMKKAVAVLSLLCLAVTAPAYGAALDVPIADAGEVIFAGGGTPLTNGIFFPGTATCDSKGCTPIGAPLQVKRGSDITFVNLDPAVLTNTHQILSLRRRGRQPLFMSDHVAGPGHTVMRTSHLKPGLYPYVCNVHYPMYGIFEILP